MQVTIFNLPPGTDEAAVREMLEEFHVTDIEQITIIQEENQSISAVAKLSRPSEIARQRHGEVLWRGHKLTWHVALMFRE